MHNVYQRTYLPTEVLHGLAETTEFDMRWPIVIIFLNSMKAQSPFTNLLSNWVLSSISRHDGIWYEMTHLSRNFAATCVFVIFAVHIALISFECLPVIKTTNWFRPVIFSSCPSMSMAQNSNGLASGNSCNFRRYLVCAESWAFERHYLTVEQKLFAPSI